MEDFYAADYSINSSGISNVARELENILESSPADPILRRDPEGALPIDPKIFPMVSILGDSESVSTEISTSIQE